MVKQTNTSNPNTPVRTFVHRGCGILAFHTFRSCGYFSCTRCGAGSLSAPISADEIVEQHP